ncbi:hypothetical protein V6N13_009755 [Hibiscus sabdariffa]
MRRAKTSASFLSVTNSQLYFPFCFAMAFPLSSSITLSFTPSLPKHHSFLTHFSFRFSQARNQENARPFQLKLQCKASKDDFVKVKLESVIAALLIVAQVTSPLPFVGWDFWSILPANAVLYSPETKLPRTGELALRRGIPANTNMKAIQASLEELSYLLRIPQRKPYGTMEGNVKKALKIAVDGKDSILASIPADLREKGSALYSSLIDGKGGLEALLKCIKDQDPDRVSVGLASSLDTVAELELLQAPGLSFLLPEQYLKYPRLTGRAVVELTIEKGDGSSFTPEVGAPLTTGNFAKLVTDGAYDGTKLSCINQAIISENDTGKNGYSVPLEIMPSGQFEPLYKTTLSIQDGELPSGLGGISFDEGQFSVFGYTIVGREILPQIRTGDVIKSAKLVEGQDRLVLPNES